MDIKLSGKVCLFYSLLEKHFMQLRPFCARLRDWSVFEDLNRSGEERSLASYKERNVVCSECEPQVMILCLYTVHLVLTCFCFCFSLVLFSLPKSMNKVYDHDQINLSISVFKMRIVNYFSHYIHAQNLQIIVTPPTYK